MHLTETIYSSREFVPILAIAGAMGLGLIWTIGLLSIAFIKALKAPRGRSGLMDADDTRSFQELERGFRRMEERVESLETLLIDKSKSESFEHKLNN